MRILSLLLSRHHKVKKETHFWSEDRVSHQAAWCQQLQQKAFAHLFPPFLISFTPHHTSLSPVAFLKAPLQIISLCWTWWLHDHFTAQHGSRGTYCTFTCMLTPGCRCQHKNWDSAAYKTHRHTITAATPWGGSGQVSSPPKKPLIPGISGTTQALYSHDDFCASRLSEKMLVNLMLSYSSHPSLQNGISKPLITCSW